MSLKQKNAVAGGKHSNQPDMDMETFILEIERNRIQMQIASHTAAIWNCPIQILDQAFKKPEPETRQPSRRKKSR